MRSTLKIAAGLVAITCGIGQAFACSIMIPEHWGAREYRKLAKRSVDQATAIIDGEVVQPFVEGKQNAIVRAHRVFKGAMQELFEVGEKDSCSLRLDRSGERRRMLLIGGPEVYELMHDGANARYEDRILKSDRHRAWPFFAGKAPDTKP